jgi:hypothetical protein
VPRQTARAQFGGSQPTTADTVNARRRRSRQARSNSRDCHAPELIFTEHRQVNKNIIFFLSTLVQTIYFIQCCGIAQDSMHEPCFGPQLDLGDLPVSTAVGEKSCRSLKSRQVEGPNQRSNYTLELSTGIQFATLENRK